MTSKVKLKYRFQLTLTPVSTGENWQAFAYDELTHYTKEAYEPKAPSPQTVRLFFQRRINQILHCQYSTKTFDNKSCFLDSVFHLCDHKLDFRPC